MPQIVKEDLDGTLTVNYVAIIPVLVEAVKEQQTIIDAQKVAADAQQSKINTLQTTVDAQKAAIDALQKDIEAIKRKVGM